MKAHELLCSPDKWVKGRLAVEADGTWVRLHSPTAVRWCVIGAIVRCYGYGTNETEEVCDRLATFLHLSEASSVAELSSLAGWNDARGRTFEDVHSALKELDI